MTARLLCVLPVLAAVRSTEGESKSVDDVDKLAELLEQADLGTIPDTEEAEALLSLASALKAMAPPSQMLSVEAEDRIFAKFLEAAPEAAPEVEADLAVIANKLQALLVETPSELTDDAADRIFAKIEQAIPDMQPAKTSRLAAARAGVVVALPRPLIQRRADELAAAIESLESGQPVKARGELADMLTAVRALQPVPAIQPSPSFVDWLEVRLMSPAHQISPVSTKLSDKLAAPFRSGRFQAGLAGAAAVIAAIAAFNLGGSDLANRPNPNSGGSSVASPAPVGQANDGQGQISQEVTPVAFVPTNPAPPQTTLVSRQENGSRESNTSKEAKDPGDPGNGGSVEKPPPSDGPVVPASDGRDLVERLEQIIREDGGE